MSSYLTIRHSVQVYGYPRIRGRVLYFSSRSSVSEEETEKFAHMANEWWDPKKNPLIAMNSTRISFITQTLAPEDYFKENIARSRFEPLRGLRMLDVGCGGGLLSESLARLGADVTAIDPSLRIVEAAKAHSNKGDNRTKSIQYMGGLSIEEMAKDYRSKQNSKFDAICILEVIEHATDPTLLLESAAAVLKNPGGVLFISTINRTIKSYVMVIMGGEYITGMLPIGTHSFQNFKTPDEVESIAKSCGLKKLSMKGMILEPRIFDFYWRLDERDLDVNYIMAFKHEKQ